MDLQSVTRRFGVLIALIIFVTARIGNAGSDPTATAAGWAQSEAWPPPSAGHVLLYHPKLEKVLLVNAGLGATDDSATLAKPTKLWSWDGAKWTVY
jgi:hypothetical protein